MADSRENGKADHQKHGRDVFKAYLPIQRSGGETALRHHLAILEGTDAQHSLSECKERETALKNPAVNSGVSRRLNMETDLPKNSMVLFESWGMENAAIHLMPDG